MQFDTTIIHPETREPLVSEGDALTVEALEKLIRNGADEIQVRDGRKVYFIYVYSLLPRKLR